MPVYDDQKKKDNTGTNKVPSDDELRRLTGINEEQESAHEREATSGAASDILGREQSAAGVPSSKTGEDEKSALDAKDKEPAGGSGSGGFSFRKEKTKGLANLKSKAKKYGKNKWVIGGAGAGGLLLLGLIILLFLIGGQLIPNFAQNMIAYSFARVTRETVDSTSKVTSESIAIDSASDSAYQQADSEFANADVDPTTNESVWDTINKYRPEKVVENLRATGQMYFEYAPENSLSPIGKLLGRQSLQKIYINGVEIDVPKNSFSTLDKILNPVDYTKQLWQSNKLLKTTLADSMDTTLRGTNWIIRGKAAAVIRDLYDIRLYRWDKQQLDELDTETPTEADVTNEQQSETIVTDNNAAATEAEAGASGQEESAAESANTAVEECMTNTECTEGVINQGGGLPSTAIDILNNVFKTSFWDGALKFLAPTYAIAAPLCMIWQASIVNSGGVINANQGELERTGYQVMTAADQQKYGDVNGNAVGAQSRQMGTESEVANSNVMKRAEGIPVDTTQSGVDPQASAGGTYTYDVFSFLGPVDNVIRPVIGTVCSVFDNPYTGLAIGLVTLLIPAVRGAISAVAESAEAGIGVFVGKLVTSLGSSVLQMFSKTELLKMGAIAGATIAGSLLAKYIALQHMAALNNGTTRNQTFDNQAEAGAILNAQDIDRQQNMGAPLTASGTAQTDAQDVSFLSQQEQQQPVFQRYFAISNANSFVSRLGIQAWAHLNLNTIPSLLLSAGRIFNPVSAFSGIFSFMENKSEAAATTTEDTADYNIIQWGWTPIEEWHYENDPNYSMLQNQQILDQSGQEQTIASTYGMCFTDKIGTLLAAGDLQRDSNGNVLTNGSDGTCAPDNVSPLNRDDPNVTDNLTFANATAQLVFRYRVAIRDQNNMNELIDTQNVAVTDNFY